MRLFALPFAGVGERHWHAIRRRLPLPGCNLERLPLHSFDLMAPKLATT